VTGRWFQGFDGERANTGILAVSDRPWKPMLEEAIKANFGFMMSAGRGRRRLHGAIRASRTSRSGKDFVPNTGVRETSERLALA